MEVEEGVRWGKNGGEEERWGWDEGMVGDG